MTSWAQRSRKAAATVNRNIHATIAYDGTDFLGWQSQPSGRTVQDTVEAALRELHGHAVPVRVAGRTDSGVHADGQSINFMSDSAVPEERFPEAMNSLLPNDVRVLRSERVGEDFDARFDARIRVYLYRISTRRMADPIARRFCWTLHREPDIIRLNRYASYLVGSHDFSTFAASGDTSASRVRTIHSACFYASPRHLLFKIAGNAFLYRMVRSLVGTMIEMEARGTAAEEMGRILEAKERERAGQTAPAWGLSLHRVIYDEREFY